MGLGTDRRCYLELEPRWCSQLPLSPQLVRYSADGLLQLGPLGSTAFLPDSKCLVDDGRGRMPTLKKCEDVARPTQRLWDFTQVSEWADSPAKSDFMAVANTERNSRKERFSLC